MDSCTFVVACLLCVFGLSLQASASLRLTMTPEHSLQINGDNTPHINISCVLRDETGQPVTLTGCGYKEYYYNYAMQFNEGPASPNYTRSNGLTGKYQGRGLEHGECGLTFGGYPNGFAYILGCRVRPLTGVWQTAAMLLVVTPASPMQYRLEPPGVTLALAGTDVTLRGRAEHVLIGCRFYLPPAGNIVELVFNSGPALANHSAGHYHGAGLSNKECGATLFNVQTSGFVRGLVGSSTPDSWSSDFTELIVMSAPESPPLLTVLTPGVLNPGDFLEATCLSKNSRPAANITWHLGHEELRSGISEDGDLDSTCRWNHDPQTVQTRLRLRVVSRDHGKKLMCRAGHLAFPSGFQNSTSYDLLVIAPTNPCTPNPCRGAHTVCQTEGQTAVCDCQDPYVGRPPRCRLECAKDTDCRSQYRTCIASRCVDVCLDETCGQDAECHVVNRAAVCKCPKGSIGDPHVRCEEEKCGRREVNPQLIAGGQNANYGEFPWHAGIYERTTLRDNTTRYEQSCGGTLITPNIVITAAHCVYEEGYQRVCPKEIYRVALGKILRDWYVDLVIDDIQRMDLDNIHVHRDYRGYDYDFRYDIAILKLSSSALMTSRVQVACVDWDNAFDHVQLSIENSGTITGFGKTSVGPAASTKLQWIELPWVNVDTCRAATDLRQRKYLSSDKFCAGYVDRGMSVCAGDSGGGLLFLNATTKRFYLRGVASTSLVYTTQKLLCYSNHYTLFTKLSDFVGWVRDYVTANN